MTTKEKTGTREWATSNINIQKGCENGCLYCYARHNAVVRFKRCTADEWSHPTIDESKVDRMYGKRRGILMFPSTHDITPSNLDACYTVLDKLLAAGNQVLIVTKPNWICVSTLCNAFRKTYRQGRILWRFTIGSTNDDVLAFWEPGAPSFEDRLVSLKYAYRGGFNTSVSIEPYLDDQVERLYRILLSYVTTDIWIGTLRDFDHRVDLSGVTDEQIKRFVVPLKEAQTDEAIGKLVTRMHDYPKIQWKDSIRKILEKGNTRKNGLPRES